MSRRRLIWPNPSLQKVSRDVRTKNSPISSKPEFFNTISPQQTNRFFAACVRSKVYAATAKNSVSQRGVKTGHSYKTQRGKNGQGSSRGLFCHSTKSRSLVIGVDTIFDEVQRGGPRSIQLFVQTSPQPKR
jgi:hypothetical protein